MRIFNAQVDWREDVGNDPRLEVLVDEIPDRSKLRFEHEDGLWIAIDDGYVGIRLEWRRQRRRLLGRCFEITTTDSGQVTLKGLWSSRAGCVNQRSFDPVVDVRLATDPAVLERGYTFRSGTLILSAAKQAIDLVEEDANLERVTKFDSDEPYWVPVRGGEI